MEGGKNGVLEYWSNGKKNNRNSGQNHLSFRLLATTPLLQHSSTPVPHLRISGTLKERSGGVME
jgi:hypothetical protein